ncbi:MAG: hypothetical protein ACFFA5_02855 [Promethearchaeota archaeon]
MTAKKYCVTLRNTTLKKIDDMLKEMGFIEYEEISRDARVEYHFYWNDRQLHLRIFSLSESEEIYGIRAHTEPSIKTNAQWHAERFLERQAGDLREKSFYGSGCRKFKAMLKHYRRSHK